MGNEINALNVANILFLWNPSELEDSFKEIKGFFTNKHSFKYMEYAIKWNKNPFLLKI